MGREIFISIYLFIFRIVFSICNFAPLRDRTVFVVSFGDNAKTVLKELKKQKPDHEVIILKSASCSIDFTELNDKIVNYESKNPLQFFIAIYHLATAKYIFVDNYFGFLSVTNFRPNVTCVQLWHAAGAIKQFGLEDLSIQNRSKRANRRFQTVYNRFHKIIVGSEQMISIFKRSFGVSEDRFLKTGIPRTDFFYNDLAKKRAKEQLLVDFPALKNKKAILYAPTYRDNELDSHEIVLNLDKMYEHFKHDYILLLRLHPAVNSSFENKFPSFIFNVSHYTDINTLLVGTDVLITDYSSIPFEFSLLHKPIVFYAYDLEKYARDRGVWPDYEERMPGPVVKTTDDVIRVIEEKQFHLEEVAAFAKEWNEYSNGSASESLVKAIYTTEYTVETQIREHV